MKTLAKIDLSGGFKITDIASGSTVSSEKYDLSLFPP